VAVCHQTFIYICNLNDVSLKELHEKYVLPLAVPPPYVIWVYPKVKLRFPAFNPCKNTTSGYFSTNISFIKGCICVVNLYNCVAYTVVQLEI